jgi:hypothetical protein
METKYEETSRSGLAVNVMRLGRLDLPAALADRVGPADEQITFSLFDIGPAQRTAHRGERQ